MFRSKSDLDCACWYIFATSPLFINHCTMNRTNELGVGVARLIKNSCLFRSWATRCQFDRRLLSCKSDKIYIFTIYPANRDLSTSKEVHNYSTLSAFCLYSTNVRNVFRSYSANVHHNFESMNPSLCRYLQLYASSDFTLIVSDYF